MNKKHALDAIDIVVDKLLEELWEDVTETKIDTFNEHLLEELAARGLTLDEYHAYVMRHGTK